MTWRTRLRLLEPAAGADTPRATTAPLVPIAIGAGCALALLTVIIARHGAPVRSLDENLHAWAIAHRGGLDSAVARAITTGGDTALTLPTLLVVGALVPRGPRAVRSRLWAGILLAGSASIGVYVGLAINSWIGRVRPPFADWATTAGGPAFPSGHTTAATLFALACGWALSGRVGPGWPRAALWGTAAAYSLAVGVSRVWLGVHWPTDVMGGWLYGVTWSCLVGALTMTVRGHQPRPEPSGPPR